MSTVGSIQTLKATVLSDFEVAHTLIQKMAIWDVAETAALSYPCDDLAASVYSVPADGLARKFGGADAGLFVARAEDGEPAGCLAFARFAEGNGEVQKLFVCSRYRGQGVGNALMEAVLTDMKCVGYAVAQLETVSFMTSAIGLYRVFGFSPCEMYRPAPEGLQPITLYMRRML